ncbi:MAG: hypothetical protein AAGA21_24840 [Pseudomonadota bacterium]
MGSIDFARINEEALRVLPALLRRWLADGQVQAGEYIARNPTRNDRKPGSFKIRLRDCRWADFATGDRGGDPISLTAYLHNLPQGEAAKQLAHMLGLRGNDSDRSR